MGDKVEAQYETLDQLVGQLGHLTDSIDAMRSEISGNVEQLRGGGWLGQGASAFYAEMDDFVYHIVNRLMTGLTETASVVKAVGSTLKQAEEDSAHCFDSQED